MSEGATGLMPETAVGAAEEQPDATSRTASSGPAGPLPDRIGQALRDAIAARTGIAPEIRVGGLMPILASDEAGEAMTFLARVSASGKVNGELVLLAGGSLGAAFASETGKDSALALFWNGARAALTGAGRGTMEWTEAPALCGTHDDIVMGLAGIFLDDAPLAGMEGEVISPDSHTGEFRLRVTSSLLSDMPVGGDAGAGRSEQPGALPSAASFPDFDPEPEAPGVANLGLMGDIELELVARLGEVDMKLEDVLALSPGSILELDRSVEDPVDLVVNGRHIGRAEVVVVGEKFALRVQEVGEKRSRGRS